MKRSLILALVLLVGCKNNNPPSLEELGFMPNDLVDIRQTPEYVPLSEYKVPEEDRNVMFSQARRESEEWDDVIHIRYDKPVKGYTVTLDLYSGDYAEMHFEKGASSFTAEIDMFEEQFLYKEEIGEYNGKETVLPYVPLVFGKKIVPKGTFGFFDVDFDGKDELVYAVTHRDITDALPIASLSWMGQKGKMRPSTEVSMRWRSSTAMKSRSSFSMTDTGRAVMFSSIVVSPTARST